GHELADVFQRLADLQPEAPMRRSVAHADAEAEAPARQLVDDRRRLRVLEWMAGVDVGDARAKRDRARRQRERLAEREAVARARAGPATGAAGTRAASPCRYRGPA